MARKFAEGLTDNQYRLAKEFAEAGICTLSQAVKAFQRRDAISEQKIAEWKIELAKRKVSLREEAARIQKEAEQAINEIRSRFPNDLRGNDD